MLIKLLALGSQWQETQAGVLFWRNARGGQGKTFLNDHHLGSGFLGAPSLPNYSPPYWPGCLYGVPVAQKTPTATY